MPLSAAEELAIVRDTLRGVQADRIRANILAAGDDSQGDRAKYLDAQEKEAEKQIKRLEPIVLKEEQDAAVEGGIIRDDVDLDRYTAVNLKSHAAALRIAVPSDAKKADVIELIEKRRAGEEVPLIEEETTASVSPGPPPGQPDPVTVPSPPAEEREQDEYVPVTGGEKVPDDAS